MTRLRLDTSPSEGVCMALSALCFALIAFGAINPPAARAALMSLVLGVANAAARILGA